MSISQFNVQQLAALYERRRRLAVAHNDAGHNFWVGVVNDAFGGTGSRSSLVDALGGRGAFVELLSEAVTSRVDRIRDEIDAEIRALGGEP